MSLYAQYPNNIFNEDLRIWVKNNLYDGDFSDLGYNGARQQMYSYTDEVSGKIHCIYTDFEMDAEWTTFPDPINAEHIIPQSFFGGVSPMRSDIYNLRPCHQSPNSARGNLDYGNVPDNLAKWYGVDTFGDYYSTTTEPTFSDNFSECLGTLWEPQEDRKGRYSETSFLFLYHVPNPGRTTHRSCRSWIDVSMASR